MVAKAVTYTGLALHFASLPPAAVSLVLRFRASHGVERQQAPLGRGGRRHRCGCGSRPAGATPDPRQAVVVAVDRS